MERKFIRDGSKLAIGSPDSNSSNGKVALYSVDNQGNCEIIRNITGVNGEYFGYSVIVNNNGEIAVGSNRSNTISKVGISGIVTPVYNSTIAENNLTNSGIGTNISMSEDGNTIAFGAPIYNYVTILDVTDINNIKKYEFNDVNTSSNIRQFARSVSLSRDGSKIAIGTVRSNSDPGIGDTVVCNFSVNENQQGIFI